MQRQQPADAADERTQLTQFLDFQRAKVLMKVEGLDREQMNMSSRPGPATPSRS